LHRIGIIHNDVKPDNVMVSSMDAGDAIKVALIDFGISKFISPEYKELK